MAGVALLAYQYGMANAGDFAITIGALDFLLLEYDHVIVLSRYAENQVEFEQCKSCLEALYKEKITILPGVFALSRGGLSSLVKSYGTGAVRLFSPAVLSKYVKLCRSVSRVYLNGGNLLRCASITDWIRLEAVLYPVKIAKRLRVPYDFLPFSTTVINKLGFRPATDSFRGASKIVTRERISQAYLKERFANIDFASGIDMAFCIQDRPGTEERFEEKYPFLNRPDISYAAITLRREGLGDIGLLSQQDTDSIYVQIRQLIDILLANEYHVVLVVQTQKDLAFSKEIADEYKGKQVQLVEEYDVFLLREIYRRMKLLAGMRLHSIILAASVGTPTLGIFAKEWGKKNPGIMQQLSMPYVFLGDRVEWKPMLTEAAEHLRDSQAVIEQEKSKLRRTLFDF